MEMDRQRACRLGKRNPAIIEAAADEFDRMMEEDRKAYLQSLNEENAMLSLL